MAKNPILPIYYNDLNGSTRTWTDEEFGAYVRLLIEQWDKGCIPTEMKRILKIADSAEKNWPVLCQKFTPGEDGFLRNSVMEEIRKEREKFSNHQSENGSKGGRPSKDFLGFRERILMNVEKIDFEFEISFCEKKKNECIRMGEKTNYWDSCISFLTKINPNKTQIKPKKKPLEDEDEIEKEKELENEIELPFTSENFRVSWQKWKDYRRKEFKKSYKSPQTEQAALVHLYELSEKNEYQAVTIINQSIANQWQGLFELKKQQNGSSSKQQSQRSAIETAIRIGQNEFAALREKHAGG